MSRLVPYSCATPSALLRGPAKPGLAILASLLVPTLAIAEPERAVVVGPPHPPVDGHISNIIFLNRCTGGCTITKTTGISDARQNQSTIPMGNNGQMFTLDAFAHSEQDWQTLLTCVRAVYAPYNVMVTDVDPGTAVHHEAIVAGVAADIGWDPLTLGVGQVSADCSAYDNGISFAFANAHTDMEDLCWTVAQETGHTYGLDHVFNNTSDGLSACTDPMTYSLMDCGRKFFRFRDYQCGESAARACRCGGSQNAHTKLLSVFGPGMPIANPTVDIITPADMSPVTPGFSVFATANAERGSSKVEVYLNGFKWLEVPSKKPNDTGPYTLMTPTSVPDGIIDVEVRATNDLQTGYGSGTITVTKGAPCATADSCAPGQKCESGRCFWDPPSGQLGEACEYPQFCLSNVCEGGVCSQSCFVGVAGDCPEDMECVSASGGGDGFCQPNEDKGGCCSVGTTTSPGALFAQLGLAGLALGGVLRRRRRR